jgi:phosphatidate cytidylyltransferase
MPSLSKNLVQRIVVAVIAIPLVVGIIWIGGWVLAATLAVLGVLGAHEIYDFGRRQGFEPLERTGFLAAAAIPLLAYWAKGWETHWAESAIYLGAAWLLFALTMAMWRRGPTGRPLTSVSVTLFGCLYASGMLAFLIAIRHSTAAATRPLAYVLLTLFPLVITWVGDTTAMATGSAIGGPRLAPVLSPRKTHAGAIGGGLGGVIAALALGKFVLNRHGWGGWHFTDGQLLLFGLAVSIVGQVGDIAESLLKREAGLKDSSSLIPGHGGVLDRLDSLYFVIPAAAGLYRMFGVI